ncbi:MBOAT-domain-containing protein [Sistotremastrum suecicum HHB10207 ss-3]|uniref:MBOAT-domain-containing protein n=1 Tax=Sistotremastrum suecicum HHB10207 ss-3 TaxID=1314776 RepID=A0A166EVR4_9AGAM|nr:MBOAT-domain-containing protein [Sistotremastrum suecicum HHB10207 ss-3]
MPSDLRSTPKPLVVEVGPLPRRGITALTVETPTSTRFARIDPTRPPARWKTPEFILYGIIFVVVVPIMVWVPVTLSQYDNPNYPLYAHRLSWGWIAGRKIDNSDSQYRSFRNNIPSLIFLSAAFLASGRLFEFFRPEARSDKLQRTSFLAKFSILVLFGLHGTSALKVLAIMGLNYLGGKLLAGTRIAPFATWVFNLSVLFLNEAYSGYHFSSLHPSLGFMDNISGFYPRWHVNFNITMLRLISFNMDRHWAHVKAGSEDTGQTLNEKQRTTVPLAAEDYSFQNYLAYSLYTPLYIAGPIMTFNDFLWQLRRPLEIKKSSVLNYAIRFLSCFLTMELILHFMYVVAIKDTAAWRGDSPFELSMIGFWNLIIVWLKLLIPWRFFRLWALMDGMDPPENMIRCMANNYSPLGFWRSWHRSYNLWIVRYIYIPLGGTKNALLSIVVVFTFVALWHDLSLGLLAWGWLVSIFITPELAARYFLPASKYGDKPWYRHVCALGGVVNILTMMTANLIGFAIGVDGVKYLLEQLLGSWQGLRFMLGACVCLFVAVQVMFEYREEEMRRGIFRRC